MADKRNNTWPFRVKLMAQKDMTREDLTSKLLHMTQNDGMTYTSAAKHISQY